ncbi:MAG: T9SS type A sorting domain-containing protein [Gemmatimonadetes bacterium]|nr:T9SS type A sorting domain-containing protein [Gemmatimonadota bacterium]
MPDFLPSRPLGLLICLLLAGSLPVAALSQVPAEPVRDFTASLGNREILLTWTPTATVTEFDLLRGPRLGTGRIRLNEARIHAAEPVTFTDSAVAPGTAYLYELVGYDPQGLEVLHAPVEVSTDRWTPGSLALRGPNPFRTETSFSFTLSAAQVVRLTVHDISGRTVRHLLDSSVPAGRRDVTWPARDDAGRRVSGGVYLLRLETDEDVHVRRLVYVGETP